LLLKPCLPCRASRAAADPCLRNPKISLQRSFVKKSDASRPSKFSVHHRA
jgi:hypothetical protein